MSLEFDPFKLHGGLPPQKKEDSIISCSSELGELFTAMALVQGKLEHANKNATNPHFRSKYADLAEVLDTGRKVAAEHGISVIQFPEGESSLVTVLAHKSGQYMMSRMTMKPTKNDPQGIGSAITYARRYAYSAVLGIAPDEDDDGNAASAPKGETPGQETAKPQRNSQREPNYKGQSQFPPKGNRPISPKGASSSPLKTLINKG